MKIKAFFMLLLVLIFVILSPLSRAACIPAPDPDLNNDGIVNSADLVIVSRSNGINTGNPRYNPMADTNCDGKVDPTDIQFVNKAFGQTFPIGPTTRIEMVDMFSGGQLSIGTTESLSSAVQFSSSATDKPFTVRVTQTLKPEYGLVLKPQMNGNQYTFSQSRFEEIKQSVSASTPGDYEVTTTSTIVETGQFASRIVKFKVLPTGTPDLSMPSPSIKLEPAMRGKPVFLKPNAITKVAFAMGSVSGKDGDKVIGMTVIEVKRNITVQLNDSGLGIDREANDRIYGSEYINIDSTGMSGGECMTFHAVVHTTMGDVNSRDKDLCVSALSVGSYRYAKEDWLQDGVLTFARNTISVSIRKGTTDARIQQLAASIDSTVVGGIPVLRSFIFKLNQIPANKDAMNVILQKSKQLMQSPEVEIAGPTIAGQVSSLSNDPLYKFENLGIGGAEIPGITQTRADEAWMVVRGKAGIAIIDTGIRANHEDLAGKVMSGGFNYAEDSFDTDDTKHHGSHVAGIAAAQSNNGKGVASVSWDSQILPLKIYEGSSGDGASSEVITLAILDAADNPDIKIINFSTGFGIPNMSGCFLLSLLNSPLTITNLILNGTLPTACADIAKAVSGAKLVCEAVTYAVSQNKIFTGAAGNSDSERLMFPAACSGALAVGAVQPSSNIGGILGDPVRMYLFPGTGSHYGSWVTMAAAGRAITSTVPLETCGTILPPICIANTTDGYASVSGTSESAPMVAGAAAVVLAKHPLFTPSQIINRLTESAKHMPSAQLGAGALGVCRS